MSHYFTLMMPGERYITRVEKGKHGSVCVYTAPEPSANDVKRFEYFDDAITEIYFTIPDNFGLFIDAEIEEN